MSIEPAVLWMSILGPGCFVMSMFVYVAHRYVDSIELLLINSKYIMGLKSIFSGAGLIGKVLRMSIIGCVLMIPGPYARRGLIDLDDVKRVPCGTKWLIVGLLLGVFLCFLLMIVFRVWIYISSDG